ncbi:hypothetical protein [Flavobacterium sp. BFFFF1]|uniref:hypothetical protein n=1 Tax=Flavobacterium sp. BFFFF1 TaxID=2015557 RepID=UPI0025BEECF8|nr:hypothetical protein [Flavobacterium sp. BFFFF1]
MKSEAVFDMLYIGNKLQFKIEDFSLSEINFFSYLSCLLSLYDGKMIDNWEYGFIKSSLGSPISTDLDKALNALCSNGSLCKSEGVDGYYNLLPNGEKMLELYSTLYKFSWRIPYLEASCKSLSLMPFGIVKDAISNEPVLKSANNTVNRRSLLEESNPATKSLHNQFSLLKVALEDKFSDLLIPAVVWIESLNKENSVVRI